MAGIAATRKHSSVRHYPPESVLVLPCRVGYSRTGFSWRSKLDHWWYRCWVSGRRKKMQKREHVVAFVFLLLGVGIIIYLCTLLSIYPLLDWAINDLAWCQAWLYYSCLDYYGSALCLSAIVFYSESSIPLASIWSLGFALLGSPACIAWVCYRLLIHGGLSLESSGPKRAFFSFENIDDV